MENLELSEQKNIMENEIRDFQNSQNEASVPKPGPLKLSSILPKNTSRFREIINKNKLSLHTMKLDKILQKSVLKLDAATRKGNKIADQFIFAHPLIKLKRCLHTALFCIKMDRINHEVRSFGSSKIQFSILFKNRLYVRNRLKQLEDGSNKPQFPKWIFNPENKYSILWTMAGFIFILYAITFMPYGMLFYSEVAAIDSFENYMNIYFMLDILVNFNTAVQNPLVPGQ